MAIDEKLNKLLQIKSDIKDAIVDKGVEMPAGLPFDQYASKVSEIEAGSKIIQMTQAEYDELAEKDPNTLYVIVG